MREVLMIYEIRELFTLVSVALALAVLLPWVCQAAHPSLRISRLRSLLLIAAVLALEWCAMARFWQCVDEWELLLIRYDKHDVNYLGLIQLACGLLWYRRIYRLQAA